MSQNDQILNYLKAGNSITPVEALEMFGCFRLGARISDLRHQGYDIISQLVERNGKRFAKYFLFQEEKGDGSCEKILSFA